MSVNLMRNARALKIGINQLAALYVLAEATNPMSIASIERKMGVKTGTGHRGIERLSDIGLISKKVITDKTTGTKLAQISLKADGRKFLLGKPIKVVKEALFAPQVKKSVSADPAPVAEPAPVTKGKARPAPARKKK